MCTLFAWNSQPACTLRWWGVMSRGAFAFAFWGLSSAAVTVWRGIADEADKVLEIMGKNESGIVALEDA